MSLSSWAHAHDIDGRSLHCWKLNLGERRRPEGFLELLGAVDEAPERTRKGAARYTVRFDGLEVEVGDDFDDSTLTRLLKVVTQC
ncbi:MAG: hypothetical protein AAF690_30210 [Acidobacteriota bacterium]